MAASFARLVALCSLAGVTAQTRLVLPVSHDAVEGTAQTSVPLGRSTPVRTQMAYAGSLIARAATLEAIGLRLDGGATMQGKQAELELRVATLQGGVLALQPEFKKNLGADATLVRRRALVDLPALSQGATPNPFHIQLPFEAGFGFDPARGALLVELVVHAQAAGAVLLDATGTCTSPVLAFGPAGCGASGRVPRVDLLTQQVGWGRTATFQLSQSRGLSPVALHFGTIEAGTWQGLPIPFDLTAIGAPGCWLSTDVFHAGAGTSDAGGIYRLNLQLPDLPELTGIWLRCQGLSLDREANLLGVALSRGTKTLVCGPEPVARVLAAGATATVGTLELGTAPVVQLTLR